MISKDKHYRARDGHEVRIYEIHDKGEAPVHGAYKLDQEWFITQWEEDGSWCLFEHSLDLIEIRPASNVSIG